MVGSGASDRLFGKAVQDLRQSDRKMTNSKGLTRMKRIVLTGFMGVGKTTVGRRLVKRLGMKFFDTKHL